MVYFLITFNFLLDCHWDIYPNLVKTTCQLTLQREKFFVQNRRLQYENILTENAYSKKRQRNTDKNQEHNKLIND